MVEKGFPACKSPPTMESLPKSSGYNKGILFGSFDGQTTVIWCSLPRGCDICDGPPSRVVVNKLHGGFVGEVCMSGVGDNNGDDLGGFDQLENGGDTTQGFAPSVDAKLHRHSYCSAV